ncbi:MAG: hypothetical protein RL186_726 [Pseudomonadota bacterium]
MTQSQGAQTARADGTDLAWRRNSIPSATAKATSWLVPSLLIALPALPVICALVVAIRPSANFAHIVQYLLADMLVTTIALVGVSLAIATCLGTLLAWLVTAFEFWGRRVLTWALVLPLAIPAYVAAYAWGDLTGVRGFWVGVLVYVTTLYPYIYLSARSAFEAQSVCALEAARVLGAGTWQRFVHVALPLARPAIVAGAALAGLEMASDYGAADHLGLSTLTIGIFRAWFSMGDLAAAARLSMILLLVIGSLVWAERSARKGAIAGGSKRWRSPTRVTLSPLANAAASGLCGVFLMMAFVVPVAHLVQLGAAFGAPNRDFVEPLLATSLLCMVGAIATLTCAGLGAFVSRNNIWASPLVATAALAGYATPGAVTALGILAALSLIGHGVTAALAGGFAVFALAYAYATRFTAAGLEPMLAGLEKSSQNMREAATALGSRPFDRFMRVDAPLAAPSAFAAALIVAVEIAKELPATTILRPLGLDTLAVRAHAYAADERLGAAAWPALAIVALALVPILIFSHGLSNARAGQT